MRRTFFATAWLCALVIPLCTFGQPAGNVHRVGFLIAETLSGQESRANALRTGLRDLGYIEGKNIVLDIRTADGKYEQLPKLAQELVQSKVDVLVAFGAKAVVAAKAVTTTIPIVVPSISDPVAMGLVKSLAQPGGNITGGSGLTAEEVYAKRFEALKESVPRIRTVAFLLNPTDELRSRLHTNSIQASGKRLKVEVLTVEARSHKDFAAAFALIANKKIEGIILQQDTLFIAHHKEIADLAAKYRIPAVGNLEFGEAGALLGYGASDAALYRRGAYFVDRILKGAKPAELPVERAMKVELMVNLRTANALGIKLPPSILVRADKVIE